MEDLYLNDIVNYYFKKLWIIVLITIVFIVGGLTYSFKIKTPMYKSTTSVILASGQTITQSDLTLYQKLINTYTQIAKSRNVLNNTISNLNLTYNYNQLKDNVTVSAVSDTEIINISVIDKSPTLAKKIADSIANNFKDEVASIYNLTNISILDESVVAQTPYNYNILKDTIIYVALGLFIGFVYVFLRYYFDRNIKSKEEVESRVNLPIMGSIRDFSKELKNIKSKDTVLLDSHPKASFVEDIKTLRTNLDFLSMDDSKIKKLLITSSIPGEGKSFVSSNLAISHALNNKKVLLIDCDLRKGIVHKKFNVKNIGLSNLIAKNDISNIHSYINHTHIENLDVITRGIVPPNPSELLNSNIFKTILNELEKEYDFIILDGTPITNLPDSLVVSGLVDKTVVVATIGYTPADLLSNTIKSLKNVNAPLAGVIINKIPMTKNGYYYYNYKYE